MVKLVDLDGSGQIEFEEFVQIISNKDGENVSPITHFFKSLVNGQYNTNDMPFNNWVMREQRKFLLDAIICKDSDEERRSKGQRILNAIKTMEDAEELEKREDDSDD